MSGGLEPPQATRVVELLDDQLLMLSSLDDKILVNDTVESSRRGSPVERDGGQGGVADARWWDPAAAANRADARDGRVGPRGFDVLTDAGVSIERTVLVGFLASPPALDAMTSAHPSLKIVTSAIEDGLDENGYMLPGIGDFGDRYFGTQDTGAK